MAGTAVSVWLSDDLGRRLKEIAEETDRSRTFHIRKAIEAYVEENADLQTALSRLLDQSDPVVSGAEMR